MAIESKTLTVYCVVCEECGSKGPEVSTEEQAVELAKQKGYHLEGLSQTHRKDKWRCPDCLKQEISKREHWVASTIGKLESETRRRRYPGRIDKIRSAASDVRVAWRAYLRVRKE